MYGAKVYVDDQLCYTLSEDNLIAHGTGNFDAPCNRALTGSTIRVVHDRQIVLCDIQPFYTVKEATSGKPPMVTADWFLP